MSPISRRTFVQAAAMLPVAGKVFAKEPLRSGNLGVQLYTVRSIIGENPAKVLKSIQDIGYTEVEATYDKLSVTLSALKETSLKAVSVHVDTQLFLNGGSGLDSALDKCKEAGFEYVVVPYIPPAQRGGVDMFKHLADTLNKAGAKAQSKGLKLCYHNHAFEFQPLNGKTGLEILVSETQAGTVSLEMDVFWVSVAGHDPVELLKTYSGRVLLVHLKDKSKSFTSTQYNENVPKETFKEVGGGSVDIPAVLTAADAAGVQNYFVEQDQTPGDPIASLRKSYDYLKGYFKS